MPVRRDLLLAPAAALLRSQDRQPNMFGDAEAYERFMGRWSRLVAPRLLDFAGLPAQGRILDAGSGTGSLSLALAERNRGTRVLGIDLSKEYVAYASNRNPYPGRVRFQAGDAQQLAFPGSSFDGAISLLVLNFIPDPKKALFELRRVTRPGGILSAAVWDYGGAMRMLRTFWDAAVHLDPGAGKLDEKHMPLCRSGELATLWNAAGLEEVREQPIEIEMKFDSLADYWNPFLLGQGPAGAHVRRLDDRKRDALRQEIKLRLSASQEDRPVVLPGRVWAVKGTVPEHR